MSVIPSFRDMKTRSPKTLLAHRDYALNLPACYGNVTNAGSKGRGSALPSSEHVRTPLASGWPKYEGSIPCAKLGWEEDGANTRFVTHSTPQTQTVSIHSHICILILLQYLFLFSHFCVGKPKADIKMSLTPTASLSQWFLRPGLSLILQLTVNQQTSWAETGMESSVPQGTVAASAHCHAQLLCGHSGPRA